MNSLIVIFDPLNMGLDDLFINLSTLLTKIWWEIDFSVMVALICIIMWHGHIFVL